ncbi:MAG TPA: MFS transporter [Vicinamibacterales bacterium]|nr:MFS transporter [Vicinamibacterales bacterium]
MSASQRPAGHTTGAGEGPHDSGATIARVIRRLIPFIFICYVVAYIDRVNIGFAAEELQRDLGLSDAAYGLGGGLFFLGYCLFEIPSNLILERVGARIWIARIMIGWGLVSMAMTFVVGQWSFYAMRVLLGIAEAGFFPGVVLYLTYWIPAAERARAGALFMTAAPVAVLVGAPVSEGLLALDGALGLSGWQWLFVVEGLPAVILGMVALWYLTDRPEQATWLPAADRTWLSEHMAGERAQRALSAGTHLGALLNGRVLLICFIYFLNTLVTYGIFLWLPRILREVSGLRGAGLSVITAVPFVVALVGMVLIGRHSDRTGERKGHVAACALTGALGLMLAAGFQNSALIIVLSFTLSQLGQRSVQGVFWAIPPIFLGGTAAAAGIALINSIGNLGGFVGPTVMGWLRGLSGSYSAGLLVLASALVLEAILVLSLKLPKEPR